MHERKTLIEPFNCSDYPPITSVEQRRKYKTEFDKDYAEYRQVHLIMDRARRRFANLQQELSNVLPSDRRYQVMSWRMIRICKVQLTDKVFVVDAFLGDSESNNPRI